jgi:hypothetical protein
MRACNCCAWCDDTNTLLCCSLFADHSQEAPLTHTAEGKLADVPQQQQQHNLILDRLETGSTTSVEHLSPVHTNTAEVIIQLFTACTPCACFCFVQLLRDSTANVL